MSLWFGEMGTAVGWQELVLRVCAGAGHQCQGTDAATQRLFPARGHLKDWPPLPCPVAACSCPHSHCHPFGLLCSPLGCPWAVPSARRVSVGLVPLQAALKGPTSPTSPQPWDRILGTATPRGHGQGMVALEQCLRRVAAQVAARQPTAPWRHLVLDRGQSHPPGLGCVPVPEMPSWDAIHVSWAVPCGAWAAAGPQQCQPGWGVL